MNDRRGAALGLLWFLLGCGPSAVSPTVGTVCNTLAPSICARAGTCTGDPSPSCAHDFEASCCIPSTCGLTSTVTDLGQLDDCRKDLKSWDCTMLGAGVLPPSCPSFRPAQDR